MDDRIRGTDVIRRVLITAAAGLILVCWLGSGKAQAQVVCSPGQTTVSMNGGAISLTCFGTGALAGALLTRIPGTAAICTFVGFTVPAGCALTSIITRVQIRDRINAPVQVVRDTFAATIPRQATRRMRDQLQNTPVLFLFVQCYLIGTVPFCANVNLHLGGGAAGPLAILKMLIYAKYPGNNEKHRLVREGFSRDARNCKFFADIRITGEGTFKGNWEVYAPTAFGLEEVDLRLATTPQDRARQRRGAFFGRYRLRVNGGNRTITVPGPNCSDVAKRYGPGKIRVLFRPDVQRQASGLSGGPNVIGGPVSLATGPGASFLIDPAELQIALALDRDAEGSFSAELKFDAGGRPVIHWTALGNPDLVVRVDITDAAGQTVSIIAPAQDERLRLDQDTEGATIGVSVLGPDRQIVIPSTTVSPGSS